MYEMCYHMMNSKYCNVLLSNNNGFYGEELHRKLPLEKKGRHYLIIVVIIIVIISLLVSTMWPPL